MIADDAAVHMMHWRSSGRNGSRDERDMIAAISGMFTK